MKFVLFSDLHLDAQFAWLGSDQHLARKRRQGLRDTLGNIVRLVQETRADALLCGGDLYEHDRFTPDTGGFLQSTFEGLDPVHVFLAPGNHDWFGPQSLYARTTWSPNVHVFTADRLAPVTLADGLTLWGAAHCAPANTDGFLDDFHVDRAGLHLALFHGSERGWFPEQEQGKIPHAPFSADQIERTGLLHALLGHFHRPRDAASHTYPGNPDPLTFGEDGLRGAVVITIRPDGSLERERHSVGVTQVHDLALDVTGCLCLQDLRERVTQTVTHVSGVARVTLLGEINPGVDVRVSDLANCAPHLDGFLVRVGGLRAGYDLDAIAREPTVRGQFVVDVRAAAMPPDEERRVITAGLRALDGRDDLEVL